MSPAAERSPNPLPSVSEGEGEDEVACCCREREKEEETGGGGTVKLTSCAGAKPCVAMPARIIGGGGLVAVTARAGTFVLNVVLSAPPPRRAVSLASAAAAAAAIAVAPVASHLVLPQWPLPLVSAGRLPPPTLLLTSQGLTSGRPVYGPTECAGSCTTTSRKAASCCTGRA